MIDFSLLGFMKGKSKFLFDYLSFYVNRFYIDINRLFLYEE